MDVVSLIEQAHGMPKGGHAGERANRKECAAEKFTTLSRSLVRKSFIKRLYKFPSDMQV